MKDSKSTGEVSSTDPTQPTTNNCGLCGFIVDKNALDTWKEVKGWVGGPRKDSMRLREDTGRYAHNECVAKVQQGQAVDQDNLFDQPAGPPTSSWSPEPWELR